MANNELTIVERLKAPISKFFKVIRVVGLTLTAIGGVIFATPISLPVTLITVAGYLTVAGSVMTAVAQATVEGE